MRYVEGDLLAGPETVIVHGCNALGRFGAGFAAAVRSARPHAERAYMSAFRDGRLLLGSVVWGVSGDSLVGNCITQATYGRDGRRHVSYEALRSCMRAVDAAAREGVPGTAFEGGFERVAMPLIGADLAGGDWAVISRIVEEEITSAEPVVYYLRGKEPVLRRAGVAL